MKIARNPVLHSGIEAEDVFGHIRGLTVRFAAEGES